MMSDKDQHYSWQFLQMQKPPVPCGDQNYEEPPLLGLHMSQKDWVQYELCTASAQSGKFNN